MTIILDKASVISFDMCSLSKLSGIIVYNVLKSKPSRCDALRNLGEEFKISAEFLITSNVRFPL